MTQKIVQATIMLLIVAFIGASFLMIGPIEEAEAWPVHVCEFRLEYNNGEWGLETRFYTHDHWWSCSFSCP